MKPYNERLPLIDAAIGCGLKFHQVLSDLDRVKQDHCLWLVDDFWYMAAEDGEIVPDGLFICNFTELVKREAELQNKPSWEDAPEWVEYIAQDRNGSWWGFYLKPVATHKDGSGISYWGSGHNSIYMGSGKVIGNWQDTLEQRTETNMGNYDNYHTALGGVNWGLVNKSMCIDIPKEQDMNDWYEKGELPPVGTKCEYRKNPDEWLVGEIFGHRSDSQGNISAYVNLNGGKNWDYSSQVDKFRPLHTEMDKLIDEMVDIFEEAACKQDYSMKRGMKALAEAGYCKIKPMSEDEFVDKVESLYGVRDLLVKELYHAGCRFLDTGE